MPDVSLTDAIPAAAGLRRPVMIHTGWRSRGTWLWSALRACPGVTGFYEPLHEELAALDARAIERWKPEAWRSGHSATGHYFDEYRPLLAGRGVTLYRPRFAFHDYFRGADERDHDLRAYLDGLLAHARSAATAPVLKFCRSLGRVSWFERQFPDAVHAVLLRDPGATWHSSKSVLMAEGNRYFVSAPLAILALNAHHPTVRDVCGFLGVTTPPLRSRDTTRVLAACWRWFLRLDWEARQRAFLAYWVATAVAAAGARAGLFDADRLADTPAEAARVRGYFEAETGLPLPGLAGDGDGGNRPVAPTLSAGPCRDAASAIHHLSVGLPHDRCSLLLSWVAAGAPASVSTRAGVPRTPHTPLAPPATPWWIVLEDRALAVVRRAFLPLRRLHGRLAPRLGTERGPRMRARLGGEAWAGPER